MTEQRCLCKRRRDARVTRPQLLADDAAGERVGADPTLRFGQGKRAQPHLSCLLHEVIGKCALGVLEPARVQHHRLDLTRHEIPHGIAELHLLQ